jgi:hypothetical protein
MRERAWQLVVAENAGSGALPGSALAAVLAHGLIAPEPTLSAIWLKLKLVTLVVSDADPKSIQAPPVKRSTEETTITRQGRATPPPSHAPDRLVNCALIRV